MTGAAPGRPEVDDDRPVRLQDVLLEGSVADVAHAGNATCAGRRARHHAPVLAFSLIPPAVVGTIRPILGDVCTTWAFMAVGIALGVYAFAALEGTTFALVGLCAAAILFGGASLFYIRFNAMRRRATSGG